MRVLLGISVGALLFAIARDGATAAPAPAPAAGASPTAPAAAATASAPAAQATASGPTVADLLKAGNLSSYKVTYKWTITGAGQNQTSEQTWYYRAPKARFDFSAGTAAGGATFSVYTLEDGTYLLPEVPTRQRPGRQPCRFVRPPVSGQSGRLSTRATREPGPSRARRPSATA